MPRYLRRLFCLIGNYCPPRLNSFFFKLAGVQFNSKKVWIGNKCYFDTIFPENISINDNVCLSYGITIITHFDPSESIKKHKIHKYKKKVIIEEGVFIGPGSIIMPCVKIRKNSFIRAGSVITHSTKENSIHEGNPQRSIGFMNDKLINKINLLNKNYRF